MRCKRMIRNLYVLFVAIFFFLYIIVREAREGKVSWIYNKIISYFFLCKKTHYPLFPVFHANYVQINRKIETNKTHYFSIIMQSGIAFSYSTTIKKKWIYYLFRFAKKKDICDIIDKIYTFWIWLVYIQWDFLWAV